MFDEYAEKNLIQPTFITEYPVEISPLAKRMPSNPSFTERFEIFICGVEYGNAFSELNDPVDQRARFERQAAERRAQGATTARVDEDFVNALEIGLPPTGRMGLRVDHGDAVYRQPSIMTCYWPHHKPLAPRTNRNTCGLNQGNPEALNTICLQHGNALVVVSFFGWNLIYTSTAYRPQEARGCTSSASTSSEIWIHSEKALGGICARRLVSSVLCKWVCQDMCILQ